LKTTNLTCKKINKPCIFSKANIFHEETFQSVHFYGNYRERNICIKLRICISKTTCPIGAKIKRSRVPTETRVLHKKSNRYIFVEGIVKETIHRQAHRQTDRHTDRHTDIHTDVSTAAIRRI
jgi:hypothetical protein